MLAVTLARLQADEEAARASFLQAEAALDSLDTGTYNGFHARRLEAAQTSVKAAQAWHKRARVALEKCENRRARLQVLSQAVA